MNMFVTILGSGAALPTGHRHCSAQVLNVGGFKLLIDCAEGTQDGIRRNHLKLQSINTIIISHLHGDHFFGLPGLLSTMHLCGRKETVTIAAPKGAREVVETTFALTGNHIGFPIEWTEMDFEEGEQRIFECNRCTVDAFRIVHTVPTYGFRITEVPRNTTRTPGVYTYCCDTAYDEAIVPHLRGSDVLCVECTFANELADLARERQHLTAGQAGRMAAEAGVHRLLLSHISARYREPEVLYEQAAAEFKNCLVATDGMRVEINRDPFTTAVQLPDNESSEQ